MSQKKYRLTEIDGLILETGLGEYDIYEGELVPLDCPMMYFKEEDEKNPPLLNQKRGNKVLCVCQRW